MADTAAVESALDELSVRLRIPADLLNVHRQQPGRSRSREFRSIRYGAFLLSYGPFERFFNRLIEAHGGASQGLPATMDKIRERLAVQTGVTNTTADWRARVRIAPAPTSPDKRAKWAYLDSQRLRDYLLDAKSLRNLLAHGADPTRASNRSATLPILASGGVSVNLMWVEGFLQAVEDLASITAINLAGRSVRIPDWPAPDRSGVSKAELPSPY